MAIKFQYNKTSLGELGKQLKMRQTALPTIKSKESALRSEVKKAKDTARDYRRRLDALASEYDYMAALWGEFDPTPEDNTPVKLKNNRFARLFDIVGSLYALPMNGTLHLTPFFAPFYMLFFAICLNDAGYGLILLLAGLFLVKKGGAALRLSLIHI